MPLFQMYVSYRATATIQVEADDEAQARQIWEDSGHQPDADEIDQEQVLSIKEVAPGHGDPSMTTLRAHDLGED